MKSISHRDLRNHSGRVLREVAQGETYEVTNRGEVVARLTPATPEPELRRVRPARNRVPWAELERAVVTESTADALADLRADR